MYDLHQVTLKAKIFESQNILNLLDHKKTKEPTLTIVLSNTIWINFYHLIIHKFIPDNEAQLSMRGSIIEVRIAFRVRGYGV
jgi:hypothetical protein